VGGRAALRPPVLGERKILTMTYALIINRNYTERELIAAELGAEGISTWLAHSEQHAIDAIQEELPAVIIWDWPARDIPPEVFMAVLRQEAFSGPLVVCSSSLELDGVPYDVLIHKPYVMDFLVTTVERLLPEASDAPGPDVYSVTRL
jgi:CheY-like chemotaxis protein